MKTVLIIGGSSSLANALRSIYEKSGDWQIITTYFKLRNKHEHILDISDRKRVVFFLEKFRPDLIINLAVSYSEDYELAYRVNFLGPLNLLTSINKSGASTRLILIGSAAEYGNIKASELPVSINQPLKPLTIYGLTKSFQSGLISFFSSQGVNVLMARIFNLFGPDMSENLFIGRVQREVSNVINGTKDFLHIGNLSCRRDYISVDAAAMQIFAIGQFGLSGSTYHVASGKSELMRDILYKYLDLFNIPPEIVKEDNLFSKRHGFDIPDIYANISETINLIKKLT